jgi:phospholipase C
LENAGVRPPLLPDTSGPLRLAKYEASKLPAPVLPGEEQHLPQQEKKKNS